MVFFAFCQAPSKPPHIADLGFGKGGRGGAPKFRFPAKNQAPPPSKLVFWPFGGLGKGGKSKNQICNLVFGPVSKPPSSLKWACWPFARPRPSAQTANLGFGKEGRGEGGGGHQNSDFQPKTKPLHPSKLFCWPFGVAWAKGGKSKNQICNLFFWPVSKPPSSLK